MAMRNPQANNDKQRSRDCGALAVRAVDRWKPQMRGPRADSSVTVIEIYDVIGYDYWTGGGITASWIADQIRGRGDLVININSPGGDFFEGLAIYNLLRSHSGKKTVNIVGLAASAASLISAAGDEVRIAAAAYVMIHNVWGLVVGDKNDMAEAAKDFDKFDQGARVIYAQQSGKSEADIAKLMDEETWLLGQEAIDEGFATALLPADAAVEDTGQGKEQNAVMSHRRAEAILSQSMTRREARALLNQIKGGKQDAAPHGKQDAAVLSAAADGLRSYLSNLK